MNDSLLRLILIATALITALSGVSQIIAPSWILSIIAVSSVEAEGVHMFRVVGMFMAITGLMFAQSLIWHSGESTVALWIGVQKLAAAVFVTWGWQAEIFVILALGVAAFDALTGVLIFVFRKRIS